MRYSNIATSTATIAAIISIVLTASGAASAGIFDDPKNLEVLPEDISAEDLRQTMRGFAQGTGSRCSACHVGKVEADLSTYDFSIDDEGIDQSVAKFRELRERYYGGYTFDFSERVLMRITEYLGAQDELDAAMVFVNLNLECFPQSSRTYVLRAQVLTEQGDIDAARSDYETALAMEPDSAWIMEQLDNLNQ